MTHPHHAALIRAAIGAAAAPAASAAQDACDPGKPGAELTGPEARAVRDCIAADPDAGERLARCPRLSWRRFPDHPGRWNLSGSRPDAYAPFRSDGGFTPAGQMVESRGLPRRVGAESFPGAGHAVRRSIVLAIAVKVMSTFANHLLHTPVDSVLDGHRLVAAKWRRDPGHRTGRPRCA